METSAGMMTSSIQLNSPLAQPPNPHVSTAARKCNPSYLPAKVAPEPHGPCNNQPYIHLDGLPSPARTS